MKKTGSRRIALLLTLALLLQLSGGSVLAAESAPLESTEEAFVSAEDTPSESGSADPAPETANLKEVTAEHTIIAFSDDTLPLVALSDSKEDKPTLEELLPQFPETIVVCLDSGETAEIPVTWFCAGDDYETSADYYFQFSPQWDETQYALAEGLDLSADAPYCALFLYEEEFSQQAVTSNTNEKVIYNFLTGTLGCNTATAVGIMANLYKESGFNPTAGAMDVNNLMSYGICEWNGPRFEALKKYCGSAYNTVEGQLKFLKYELETTEKNAWSKMQGIPNTAEGAYAAGCLWAQYFERCVHYYNGINQYITRGNLAKNTYWPEYSKVAAAAPETGAGTGTGTGSSVSTLPCAAPKVPVLSNTAAGIKIQWKAVAGAAKYRVFRKTASTNWVRVTDTSALSCTDTKLTSGTNYIYTVRCINSSGTAYTSVYNATGSSLVRLNQPTCAVENIDGGIYISWSKISGAQGYYIYRKTSTTNWIRLKAVAGTSKNYMVNDVVYNSHFYIYTVRAYSGSTLSSYNASGSSIYCLNRSTISKLSSTARGKITVRWKRNSKSDGYQIQYATNSSFKNAKTVTVSGASKYKRVISGLSKGKRYYVRVRSVKKYGGTKYYACWSNVKSVKVKK